MRRRCRWSRQKLAAARGPRQPGLSPLQLARPLTDSRTAIMRVQPRILTSPAIRVCRGPRLEGCRLLGTSQHLGSPRSIGWQACKLQRAPLPQKPQRLPGQPASEPLNRTCVYLRPSDSAMCVQGCPHEAGSASATAAPCTALGASKRPHLLSRRARALGCLIRAPAFIVTREGGLRLQRVRP